MTEAAVFVTGATGYLGHELVARLESEGIPYRALGREEIDLLDPFGLAAKFEEAVAGAGARPVLLHAAAMSRYYGCEEEPENAWRANTEATGALMSVLRRRKGRMLYVSTDLVFDGEHAPYHELAEARPASIYGKSKLGGENMVAASQRALIVRLPLLWGPSFDGQRGASDSILTAAREGRPIRLFVDEWRTPLHVREAAARVVALALDTEAVGVLHLPGPERLTRYDLGIRVLQAGGFDPRLAKRATQLELPEPRRPRDCSLRSIYEAPEE